MSILRSLANAYMRLVEKPRMAKAEGPLQLRKALEQQAKYLFHAPRGTTQTWVKLKADGRAIDALEILPRDLTTDRVIFYIHGGAFVFGSPRTHAAMLAQLGRRLGMRAILPKYRLAPEQAFPAAADDVRAAWDGVLASGVAPENIVIGGDSAGGALALVLLAELIAENADLPACAFCFSPLTDLTFSGDSFRQNAKREAILPAQRASELAQMYLQGHPATDPRASPLFATLEGASPLWLTVGDSEILRDDSHRIAAKIKAQGGDVTLIEAHDLPHVWPILHNILPEARQTLDTLAAWIKKQPGWRDES